jgi:hypothetical protein
VAKGGKRRKAYPPARLSLDVPRSRRPCKADAAGTAVMATLVKGD